MININLTEDGNSIEFASDDIYPDGIIMGLNNLRYRVVNGKIKFTAIGGEVLNAPGLYPLSEINNGDYTTLDEFKNFFQGFFRKATGGGGGGVVPIFYVENNEYDMSKSGVPLWTPTGDANLIFVNEPAGNYETIINVQNTGGLALTIIGQAFENNPDGLTTVTVKKVGETYTFTSDAAISTPTITLQPIAQTVDAGEDVSLVINFTANPAATIQWKKSTNSGSSYSNLSGETSKTLSIPAAETGDTGLYKATVTNTEGSVDTVAVQVTVNAASGLIALTKTDPLNPAINKTGNSYLSTAEAGMGFNDFLASGNNGRIVFELPSAGSTCLWGFDNLSDGSKLVRVKANNLGSYYNLSIYKDGYGSILYNVTLAIEEIEVAISVDMTGADALFTFQVSTDGVSFTDLEDSGSVIEITKEKERYNLGAYFDGAGQVLDNPRGQGLQTS